MMTMMMMAMMAPALAQDWQVCDWEDTTYTMNDWVASGGNIALWDATMTPYEFVIGAGGGAVEWNGSTLTTGGLAGIFSQGPSGFTAESAGHIKDGNGAPLDHLVWIAVTKNNENARKYFFVLSDRSLTGDSDERMWGDFSQVWGARYVQNPGEGIVWPSNAQIIDNIETHATAFIAKWEAGLSTGSGALTATAKANCANVYGTAACNAMTWKHAAPHFEVFPLSGGMTIQDWADAHTGTYHIHHAENTDTTYASVSMWLLMSHSCNFGSCEFTMADKCALECMEMNALSEIDCLGDSACVCVWEGAPPNCWLHSCKNVDVTKIIPSDW